MRTSFVLVNDPVADALFCFGTDLESVHVDAFVFQRSPQALNHAVVDPVVTPVHVYFHLGLVQRVGEIGTSELGAVV